jgi:hypothetical protein
MIEDLLCIDMKNATSKPPRTRCLWQNPVPDWQNVNTNGAFSVSSTMGAGGVIIRDDDGHLLAAVAKRYTHLADA